MEDKTTGIIDDELDSILEDGSLFLQDRINRLDFTQIDELAEIVKFIKNSTEAEEIKSGMLSRLFKGIAEPAEKMSTALRMLHTVASPVKYKTLVEYLTDDFFNDIAKNKTTASIKTGYDSLDKKLNGLASGLYIFGGISSVGKTSFLLQMADQLCRNGEHCIFFTLEQGRAELVSKILARRINVLDSSRTVTALNIRQGLVTTDLTKVFNEFVEDSASRLVVKEIGFDEGIEKIADVIIQYIEKNNVRPIIFIDYLQIIPSDKSDIRQGLERNITYIKKLTRDLDIPIWGVSSMSRDNYKNALSMKSFKETGLLEYSADYVFGLEYETLTENGTISESELRQEIQNDPRNLRLACLKNRSGATGWSIKYDYYPAKETFKEVRSTRSI